MRASAQRNSTYYEPRVRGVLFNGLRVRFVVEADEECGWILVLRRNARGSLMVNRRRTGARAFVAHGAVKLLLRRESPC